MDSPIELSPRQAICYLIIEPVIHTYMQNNNKDQEIYLHWAFWALSAHLLFQLLIVALSAEHFLFLQYKTKTKKFREFHNIFRAFSKFYKIQKSFVILSIHKPFVGSCEVPHKI